MRLSLVDDLDDLYDLLVNFTFKVGTRPEDAGVVSPTESISFV